MELIDFIKNHNKDEKTCIITDNVKNLDALFDRYALSGLDILNIRRTTPLDLAIDIINTYNAKNNILEPVTLINGDIGSIFIEKIIRDIKNKITFCPIESLCKATSLEILNNINLIRLNKTTDSYKDSKDSKIKELKKIIEIYEKVLDDNKLYDESKIYDKAFSLVKKDNTLIDKNTKFIKYNFNNKENYKAKLFLDLYFDNKLDIIEEKNNENFPNIHFRKSYGLFTEVYNVLKDIHDNKLSYGDVAIMYTSDDYVPYIESIFGENKVKVNFIDGINAFSNLYVKLVRDILEFIKNGYIYEELKTVCFNKLINIKNVQYLYLDAIDKGLNFGINQFESFVENVKEVNDESDSLYKYKDQFTGFLEGFVNIYRNNERAIDIYKATINLVDKYTYDHFVKEKGKALLNQIKNNLNYIEIYSSKEDTIELILEEMDNIKIYDKEEGNIISARKFEGYNIVNRKKIFILGLSSEHYKIKTTESPILSDDERNIYIDKKMSYVPIKKEAPNDSKKELIKTITSFMPNAEVYISMSNFDVLNHMELAESTLYSELLRKTRTKEDLAVNSYPNIINNDYKFDKNRFFEEKIEEDDNIFDKEKEENEIDSKYDVEGYVDKDKKVIDKYFSKSSLESFASCPLKYHYEKEAKIKVENYVSPNDNEWLDVAEQGSFVHEIFEIYARDYLKDKKVGKSIDEEGFNKACEEAKKNLLISHPVDSENMAKAVFNKCETNAKEYIKRLHKELSNEENKWIVHSTEEKFGGDSLIVEYKVKDKIFRVHYNGFIDRADVYEEDGKKHVRLIDYKTGGMNKDKYDKSMQQDIYALYYKSLGYIVDEFVYEFVFDDTEDSTHNILYKEDALGDPVEKNSLAEKFYDVFIDGKYITDDLAYDEKSDRCKYCNYKDICLIKLKKLNKNDD